MGCIGLGEACRRHDWQNLAAHLFLKGTEGRGEVRGRLESDRAATLNEIHHLDEGAARENEEKEGNGSGGTLCLADHAGLPN